MTAPVLALASPAGRRLVSVTVLGSAVAMLTATVVNVALPALARDLGAGSSGQKWVINAYLLTLASLILVGGGLGDRYGRVRVYRVGLAWFGLASLACAAAPTTPVLVGARLLQGVGGALLTPGSLAIIEASLRPEDRGRGVGRWSALTGVAAALGPLLGGALVDAGSWRVVFLLSVPVAGVALVMSRALPESADPGARHAPFDVAGAVLVSAGLAGLSYGLIEGPEQDFSPVEMLATAGGLALPAAAVLERRRRHALVPLDLFADRTFLVASVVTLLVYGALGVVFFLLSVQLQVTAGWSPLAAGAALLPVTAIMLALSPSTGDLAHRAGPRGPLTAGPLTMALGMVLLTRVGPGASYVPDLLPGLVVFGLGLSATVAPVTFAALSSVPDERAGAASAANNSLARTGQLLAVAGIPAAVGLSGEALNDPGRLDPGFSAALLWAATLTAASGAAAWALLRAPRPAVVVPEPAGRRRELAWSCPVDGPVGRHTP